MITLRLISDSLNSSFFSSRHTAAGVSVGPASVIPASVVSVVSRSVLIFDTDCTLLKVLYSNKVRNGMRVRIMKRLNTIDDQPGFVCSHFFSASQAPNLICVWAQQIATYPIATCRYRTLRPRVMNVDVIETLYHFDLSLSFRSSGTSRYLNLTTKMKTSTWKILT